VNIHVHLQSSSDNTLIYYPYYIAAVHTLTSQTLHICFQNTSIHRDGL